MTIPYLNCLKNNKLQKGFTLMEVMVAVSIFTIIVTVGIAALLIINNTHKKSQIDRQAVDSLGYVLESMSRSLRTAQSWDSIGNTIVIYHDQDGNLITYSYESDGARGYIRKEDDVEGHYPVTPENVDITEFRLTPYGGPDQPGMQHYLQINISGTITNGRQEANFAVQTSVSKRLLDTTGTLIP